eukprot:3520567-Karenia_brevis.AAC.1
MTVSIVKIGHLYGKPFKEVLGVREGGVESPYLFCAYIAELRAHLEMKHPRLCHLAHFAVAVILYADDAALPADSLDDLILSAQILEAFCNEMRLYISTAKTYVMIFHAGEDDGVSYEGDSCYVDGKQVKLRIYGELIKCTRSFKYLGVVLDPQGMSSGHFQSRLTAFRHAMAMMISGLGRLPASSFQFIRYLWRTLVAPVSWYGFELFDTTTLQADNFRKCANSAWRQLLMVGGRAPADAIKCFTGVSDWEIEVRLRRAAFFVRLLNAPTTSWQHAALLVQRQLRTT